MHKGFFIVFEGPEGGGKSTQIMRAHAYLRTKTKYQSILTTQEPGALLYEIRDLVNKSDRWCTLSPQEHLLFFLADGLLHMEFIIKPALEKGSIVLCDRFRGSTIAYQGYGEILPIEYVQTRCHEVSLGVQPDLILLLDLPPEIGLGRNKGAANFEQKTLDFHQRVREGFLTQAKEDPARWHVIDATQPIEVVSENIKKYLDELLKERGNIS